MSLTAYVVSPNHDPRNVTPVSPVAPVAPIAPVAPVTITTDLLPAAVTGVAYSPLTMNTSGGAPNSKVWSVYAGALPAGMALSTVGMLSGQPAARGSFSFTARVDDGVLPAARVFALNVYDPLVITTQTLPGGTQGTSYGPANLTATGGGAGTITWSSASLPPGVAISGTGQISGTAAAAGTYSVDITATDTAAGQSRFGSCQVSIAFPQLLLSAIGDIGTAVGGSISKISTPSGGRPPYQFAASGLPAGITIDSGTGTISGNGTSPGKFPFTVTVTDAQGHLGASQRHLPAPELFSRPPTVRPVGSRAQRRQHPGHSLHQPDLRRSGAPGLCVGLQNLGSCYLSHPEPLRRKNAMHRRITNS